MAGAGVSWRFDLDQGSQLIQLPDSFKAVFAVIDISILFAQCISLGVFCQECVKNAWIPLPTRPTLRSRFGWRQWQPKLPSLTRACNQCIGLHWYVWWNGFQYHTIVNLPFMSPTVSSSSFFDPHFHFLCKVVGVGGPFRAFFVPPPKNMKSTVFWFQHLQWSHFGCYIYVVLAWTPILQMILDYYLGPYMCWYIEPGSWFYRAPTDRYLSMAQKMAGCTLKMSKEQLRIQKKTKLNNILSVKCICFYGWSSIIGKGLNIDSLQNAFGVFLWGLSG